MFEQSRRGFFKTLGSLAGLALLAPAQFSNAAEGRKKAEPKKEGGELPLVEPGKDMAATVNYVHTNKDIKDAKLKTERQGVAFEQQNCAGCALYMAKNKKEEVKGKEKGKEKVDPNEVGTCTLFAGKVVKGTGWCNSWNKKA
jgi:hypothetical protein